MPAIPKPIEQLKDDDRADNDMADADRARFEEKEPIEKPIETGPEKIGFLKHLRQKVNEVFSTSTKQAIDQARSIEKIKAGEVGAEGGIKKLIPGEIAATDDLDAQNTKAINKQWQRKIEGNWRTQEAVLDGMWASLAAIKESPEDLAIYDKLLHAGSKRKGKDSYTKYLGEAGYANATEQENKRLAQLEGPIITDEVLKQMALGEIPWTLNGVFIAKAELNKGRSFDEDGELKTDIERAAGKKPTPSKFGTAAKVAGAALGAAAIIGSVSKGEAKTAQELAHEQEIAAKTKELEGEVEQAKKKVAEQTEFLARLDEDGALIYDEIKAAATDEQKKTAIEKNLPLLAEYAQLMGGTEEQMMEQNEYFDQKIRKGLELLGMEEDATERMVFLETVLTNALRGLEKERADCNATLSDAKEDERQAAERLADYVKRAKEGKAAEPTPTKAPSEPTTVKPIGMPNIEAPPTALKPVKAVSENEPTEPAGAKEKMSQKQMKKEIKEICRGLMIIIPPGRRPDITREQYDQVKAEFDAYKKDPLKDGYRRTKVKETIREILEIK